MNEYKGIKRGQSRDVFFWLDNYCKDTDPQTLENDIELQRRVKIYNRIKTTIVLSLNIFIWTWIIYAVNEMVKG